MPAFCPRSVAAGRLTRRSTRPATGRLIFSSLSGRRFRKGFDPRRHAFNAEECSEVFWAGLASYVEKGGEARNFLRRKMRARGQTFRHMPKAERGRLPA